MTQKLLSLGLSLSLFVLSFYILFESRRSVCIEISSLSRVNLVKTSSTESGFNCKYSNDSSFDPQLVSTLNDVQRRLASLETLLQSTKKFRKDIQITVHENRPFFFRLNDHHIEIGRNLFAAPGHLEKAFIKIWYRENALGWFLTDNLFEEVITDFVLFLNSGSIEIVDPVHRYRTRVGGARWPQVIKSVQGYCESSWRLSEHYEHCLQVSKQEELLHSDVIQLSLRPLVTSSWVKAYKNLDYSERNQFVKVLPKILQLTTMSAERRLAQIMSEVSPVQQAMLSVKNFSNIMNSSIEQINWPVQRVFSGFFTNDLRQSGLNDAFTEAFFDMIYMTDESLNNRAELFKNLKEIAKKNPSLQLAVVDKENLWMLPSEYPISLKAFGQIKSSKMILSRCGSFDFNYILSFSALAEKLLVIDKCGKPNNLDFAEFISDGVAGFARKNKNVAFIQFHLPSLAMRKDQLSQVKNVYEFIETRNTESPVFQALGWNELLWDQKTQAYKPQAFIDGIELFRTQAPQTN